MARGSDRGLANQMLLYFATLVAAILLWVVLNDPFTTMMDYTQSNCATSACTTGSTWISQAWGQYMWPVLVVAMLFLISAAIYEARRPA